MRSAEQVSHTRGFVPPRFLAATFLVLVAGAFLAYGQLTDSARADTGIQITDMYPTSGPLTGGDRVFLTGSGLDQVTSVSFAGAVVPVEKASPNDLSVLTPPGTAPGPVSVVLVASSGATSTSPYRYTYDPPHSTITSISPTSGTIAGGTVVSITGSHLQDVVRVTFGQRPAVITGRSATTVTVTTPPGAVGRVAVSTFGPNGQSDYYAYRYTTPPQVAYSSPAKIPLSGSLNVSLSGTYLDDVNSVLVDGRPVNFVVGTTYLSPLAKTISIRVPARTTPGPAVITLTSPMGTAQFSNVLTYESPPKITSVTPDQVLNNGGATIRLDGSGFVESYDFSYSNQPLQVSVNGVVVRGATVDPDGTWITFAMPSTVALGDQQILVRNPFGQATATIRTFGDPVARALTPISGPSQGGSTASLTGTDLDRVTAVHFGALDGEIVRATATSLVVRTPPSPAHGPGIGQVDVTVDTAWKRRIPTFQYFTYMDPPSVDSLRPTSGEVVGGELVTLVGANLDTARSVSFGTDSASIVSAQPGELVVRAPQVASPRTVAVKVITSDGEAVVPNGFTYVDSRPVLTAIDNGNGFRRGGDRVTLTGSNLDAIDSVRFGANPAAIISMSATSLTVVVPPSETVGAVSVYASNVAGESVRPVRYSYRLAIPMIFGVSPANGPWAGGSRVEISGANFEDVVAVNFGAAKATVVSNSGTRLEVLAPPAANAGASAPRGAVPVVVAGADGTASRNDGFTYVLDVPRILSLNPDHAYVTGGETFTILGENLQTTRAVRFGYDGPFGTIVRVAPDSVDVVAPEVSLSGNVTLLLANDYGSTSYPFSYLPTPPAITRVEPAYGPPEGGTEIRIVGSGFSQRSPQVLVGGRPATLLRGTATELVVRVPASLDSGTVDIVVTDAGGTATLARGFSYRRPPVPFGVTPVQGGEGGGTTVRIQGKDLQDVTSVLFGGRPATVQQVTPVEVTVVTPEALGPGMVDVVVGNGSDSALLPRAFTYLAAPPEITGISPAAGDKLGGTRVTISGSGFGTDPTVTFGRELATVVSKTPNRIQVVAPPGSSVGPVVVTVSTGTGESAQASGFAYVDLRPVVIAVTPDSGSVVGGDDVTLTGENLEFVTSVQFGDADPISVSPMDGGSIEVTSPPASTAGPVDVTLSGSHGSVVVPGGFTYERRLPVVTSITPDRGPMAGGGTMRIRGSRFGGLTKVLVGGEEATVVSSTATLIVLRIPRADDAGLVPIAIATRHGRATVPDAYEYESPGPVVRAVGPASGPVAGGNIAEIHGTHLGGVSKVTFGGRNAAIQSASATLVTVVVPAAQVQGPVDVVVTSSTGSDRVVDAYTYQHGPGGPGGQDDDRITVTSVTPTSGPMSGGTVITITGTNLNLVTGATMGTPAARIVAQSATSITLESPPADSDYSVNIVLDHAKGGIEAASFTYVR